jgi:hypothetical protein
MILLNIMILRFLFLILKKTLIDLVYYKENISKDVILEIKKK